MRVLSLGMSRTGTASMCAAYELLGIPSYRMFQITSLKAALVLTLT